MHASGSCLTCRSPCAQVLTDFPSVSPPLGWLLQVAPRLRPRHYSIASAPLEGSGAWPAVFNSLTPSAAHQMMYTLRPRSLYALPVSTRFCPFPTTVVTCADCIQMSTLILRRVRGPSGRCRDLADPHESPTDRPVLRDRRLCAGRLPLGRVGGARCESEDVRMVSRGHSVRSTPLFPNRALIYSITSVSHPTRVQGR